MKKEGNENNDVFEYDSPFLLGMEDYSLLSDEETKMLLEMAQNGSNSAFDMLVYCNKRLVLKMANIYKNSELDFSDLFQEGMIGLMSAIKSFDFSKNVQFSTYACGLIKTEIKSAIGKKARLINIGDKKYFKVRKFKKARAALEEMLEREPTIEELASYLNISVETAKSLSDKCADALYLLDISDDRDTILMSADSNFEEDVMNKFMVEDVRNMLENCKLKNDEKFVILHRFALLGNKKLERKEMANILGVSWEWVRMLEKQALKKLKTHAKRKDYGAYIDFVEKCDYTAVGSKTIFELLNCYDEELVYAALSKLNRYDKSIIEARWGTDLSHPVFRILSEAQAQRFFQLLISLQDSIGKLKKQKAFGAPILTRRK